MIQIIQKWMVTFLFGNAQPLTIYISDNLYQNVLDTVKKIQTTSDDDVLEINIKKCKS